MGRALIVSAGASSNEYISARLAELGYTRPTIIPSGAEARRRMLESDFELIVVNAPLPDEFGHELCSSAVEKSRCRRGAAGQGSRRRAAAGPPMSEQGGAAAEQAVLQHAVPAGHPSGRSQQPPPAAAPSRKRADAGKDRTGTAGQPCKMLSGGAGADERGCRPPLH